MRYIQGLKEGINMSIITKSEARKIARENLGNMSEFERTFSSEMIIDDIIASGLLHNYASVLMYKALPNEVNVDRLIEWAVGHGKAVYLPRVCGNDIEIVKLPCELIEGAFRVLEPLGECSDIDPVCVITPLLAVDKDGNRLGKGKGYYDRYFAHNQICYKVGVAYRQQLLDSVPVSEHDAKLDKVFYR